MWLIERSVDGWNFSCTLGDCCTKLRSCSQDKPNFSAYEPLVKVQTNEPSAHHQSYPDNFMNEWMEMFAFK